MKAVAVVLLLVALAAAQDSGKVVLCGRRLAEARELLCYGSEPQKRSPMDNFISHSSDEDKWSMNRDAAFSRQMALSGRWARGKRIIVGLVDECCNKPCAPNEILNYC